MNPARVAAAQVVHDVLALRGGVRLVAVEPQHLPRERVLLAKSFEHLVPPGTTTADVARVATAIAPHLARTLNG